MSDMMVSEVVMARLVQARVPSGLRLGVMIRMTGGATVDASAGHGGSTVDASTGAGAEDARTGFRLTGGVTPHSLANSCARSWFSMSLVVPSSSRTRNILSYFASATTETTQPSSNP
jgi:hypothetical protein